MKIARDVSLLFLLLTTSIVAADDQAVMQSDGVSVVKIGETKSVNEMAFFPQDGIADRPLLIAAHGGGGSGLGEIQGWITLAKQHNFTVVCPTFLSGRSGSMYVPIDASYFKDCLLWIENNLQYDKKNVYMTGMSGGGYPVWYLATTRPDFFKGLFLQSGNFAGQYYGLDLSGWHEKPIKLIWGSQDLPDIPGQNHQAIALLEAEHCKNYSSQIISGGHHEEHRDLVVDWMEHQVETSGSN